MRIDDICLVVSDIDRADDFYGSLGLERRMRNVRFVDFRLGDGARLAMWEAGSIAETVGSRYPRGSGMAFTVTLDRQRSAPGVFADPDGFTIIQSPSVDAVDRLAGVTLQVADLTRSAGFLETLGFEMTGRGEGWIAFGAETMTLTLTLDRPGGLVGADPHDARVSGWPRRVMLAIELETGAEVDDLYESLRAQGLADSGPPRVYEWGSRSVYFVDHDGYIWEIYAWVETPR